MSLTAHESSNVERIQWLRLILERQVAKLYRREMLLKAKGQGTAASRPPCLPLGRLGAVAIDRRDPQRVTGAAGPQDNVSACVTVGPHAGGVGVMGSDQQAGLRQRRPAAPGAE